MPRPALITLNHIREAIETLNARGQSTTNRSIRDIVGFGSFDTIGKLRKQLDIEPVATTEQPLQLQQDNDNQELRQAREDYRELWHEAASDCAALREQLVTGVKSTRRYTATNLPLRELKDIYKLYFEGKKDREISRELHIPLSVIEYVLLR